MSLFSKQVEYFNLLFLLHLHVFENVTFEDIRGNILGRG